MIQQGQTTSFLAELYSGTHNLLSNVVMMALYTSNVSLTQDTTVYSSTNEITGTGYVAGGKVVSGFTVGTTDGIAFVSFDPVIWNAAAFTARCALLYNATQANKSIAVIDFGADKTCTTIFTVTPPVNTATTALIRSSTRGV